MLRTAVTRLAADIVASATAQRVPLASTQLARFRKMARQEGMEASPELLQMYQGLYVHGYSWERSEASQVSGWWAAHDVRGQQPHAHLLRQGYFVPHKVTSHSAIGVGRDERISCHHLPLHAHPCTHPSLAPSIPLYPLQVQGTSSCVCVDGR